MSLNELAFILCALGIPIKGKDACEDIEDFWSPTNRYYPSIDQALTFVKNGSYTLPTRPMEEEDDDDEKEDVFAACQLSF